MKQKCKELTGHYRGKTRETYLAAIEEKDVTPDMSVSDICDALKEAMTAISVDGLTGTGMTWKSTGEVNKAPKAVKIVNGVYTAQ